MSLGNFFIEEFGFLNNGENNVRTGTPDDCYCRCDNNNVHLDVAQGDGDTGHPAGIHHGFQIEPRADGCREQFVVVGYFGTVAAREIEKPIGFGFKGDG